MAGEKKSVIRADVFLYLLIWSINQRQKCYVVQNTKKNQTNKNPTYF